MRPTGRKRASTTGTVSWLRTASFASLVDVPSEEVGPTLLVAPNDVDGSYLINKLTGEGMAPGTQLMPIGAVSPLCDAKIDGVGQKMFRRSFPYGGLDENGLYFIAFSCDAERVRNLLNRMYGVAGDGLRDHLTDFTRAVTGAFWFVPSLEDLDRL